MPKQPRMPGGRPQKMPDMQQMLKQLEKVQQDIKAAEDGLKDERVQASSGGGVVTVEISGDLELKSVAIDPEALAPAEVSADDLEMLADMVLAAVNEGLRAAQALAAQRMEQATGPLGGLGGPGGLGGAGGLGGLGGAGGPGGALPDLGGLGGLLLEHFRPTGPEACQRARRAARHRQQDSSAARVSHLADLRRGRKRARGGDHRSQGEDRPV